LRLKGELDSRRLWVNAYSNDVPCYIPSERVLKEGRYEGGGAMVYYDLPGPFKPGLQQPIVDSVKRLVGDRYRAPYAADKTGGTVWRKGVLVCAAPDILYAEDTDGDGKADVVKKLFTGFGTHNYQARVNSLEYGLDGWVYGASGLFGGTITSFTGTKLELG